jgi:hypothetical protein
MNMVHISPGARRLGCSMEHREFSRPGGPLILYGPWLKDDVPTAPSNLAFDCDLRSRDETWGLRRVEDFSRAAEERGFRIEQTRQMPANNLMLLLRPLRTNQ